MAPSSDSHSRRFSYKEFCLLIFPCLILVGLAFALRNHGGNVIGLSDPNKFQLYVEKHEFEPVTPYEISQGYSAKLNITLNHTGPTPKWWGKTYSGGTIRAAGRLTYRKGAESESMRSITLPGQVPPVKTADPFYDPESVRYISRVFMPLSRIPVQTDDVVLLLDLAITGRRSQQLSPTIPVNIVVRGAGEPIEVPRVSTNSNIILKNVEVRSLAKESQGKDGCDTEVRFLLTYTGPREEGNPNFPTSATSYDGLIDARSRTVKTAERWLLRPGIESPMIGNYREPYTEACVYRCNLGAVPKGIGALYVKSKYSVNKCWPLIVKIPVRNVKGQPLLTRKSRTTHLKVTNTSLTKDGADMNAAIDLQYSGSVSSPKLLFNYSQHLIDEKGQEYWRLADTKKKGLFSNIPSNLAPSPNSNYRVIYRYRTDFIPLSAGRVWLKTEIAAGNNALLPVKVLVRDTPLATTRKNTGTKSPAL